MGKEIGELQKWRIKSNMEFREASGITVRQVLGGNISNLNPDDHRPTIHVGHGDPTPHPCFRPAPATVDAVSATLHSSAFNGYSSSVGILPARELFLALYVMAIAKYLSRDLPYKLSPDDVFVTSGCHQSIEVALGVLANLGANIMLPKAGYPSYLSRAELSKIEVRHFGLLLDNGWEVDLDYVQALADENTAAIVIINPGNPCGNVYSYVHLQKVAETARKLVILGSISKRWIVPGWRLGWLVIIDLNGVLKKNGLTKCVERFLSISADPVTFIQGAVPQLLEDTKDDFFSRVLDTLRQDVDICWEKLNEIPCITCPYKPQGGMSIVAKLDLSMLDGIKDDSNLCKKLAKEESVIVLPCLAVGLKNWIRLSYAIEPTLLEDALEKIKAYCLRHTN